MCAHNLTHYHTVTKVLVVYTYLFKSGILAILYNKQQTALNKDLQTCNDRAVQLLTQVYSL